MARSNNKTFDFKLFLIIFVLALGYRAIGYYTLAEHPLLTNPVVDAGYHHAWAGRIVDGDRLGHGPDDVFKPPLYAYFLAGVYAISDKNVAPVQYLQFILGALSCGLTALIASRFIDRKTGIIAGMMSAFYAPFLFFELQLLTPALGIFLNLSALFVLTGGLNKGESVSGRRIAGAGILFGLSACVRPDVLLPAAAVGAFIVFYKNRRPLSKKALRYGFFILMILVCISPVAIRNYRITGEFIPVSSNAGINFYVGNSIGADGVSAVPVGLRWERMVASVPQEILEKPGRASSLWMRRTFREIKAEPLEAIRRIEKKAAAFFNFQEFRNNISFHFMQRESALLRFPFFQYALVLPLALAGIFLWLRNRKDDAAPLAVIGLWVGGFFLAGILFFVNARFRLPAVPLMMVPAAFFVSEVPGMFKNRWVGLLVLPAVVLLAGIVLGNPRWFTPAEKGWVRDYVNLGNALRNTRENENAEAAYLNALGIENDPDAHYLLARLLYAKRDYRGALKHIDEALSTMPESPDPLLLQAQILLAMNKIRDAEKTLHRFLVLASSSNLMPKRNEWAQVYVLLADIDAPRRHEYWEKAWRISPVTAAEISFIRKRKDGRILETFRKEALAKPWDWYSQANYGMVLLREGRFRTAALYFEKALQKAPERKNLEKLLDQAIKSQNQ